MDIREQCCTCIAVPITSSTVMSSFYKAVNDYGLPDQVRSDLGGENTDVWLYMIEQKQSESAVLVGSSTHNQRIERLWRDTYRCVVALYVDLFQKMEADSRLNLLNEIDLFCLHVVFLPRINRDLISFIECWSNHSLSTEGNLTPNQLFIEGAIENNVTISRPSLDPGFVQYTIPSSNVAVDVPRSSFVPCDNILHDLELVDKLQNCSDFGYSIYRDVCNTVGSHLLTCNHCS